MPTLKIKFNDTLDCTPKRIFVNGNKAHNKGFKDYKFEITEGEPVKIQILNTIQNKKDKFYFCFCAFLDIFTSTLRDFLDNNSLMFQSEYEIILTDDAEIEIEPTKDGFIITEHSESCQIISEKHEKEEISKTLLRVALAPIFVLIATPLIAFLILGIIALWHSNYSASITMFALMLVWGFLTGYGLKKSFKK